MRLSNVVLPDPEGPILRHLQVEIRQHVNLLGPSAEQFLHAFQMDQCMI